MKTKIITLIFTLLITITFMSCTPQDRAKNWGGQDTIFVEKNEKVIIVTWKDSDLWILTKPMTEKDSVETYKFTESSSYGLFEGTIIIKEQK